MKQVCTKNTRDTIAPLRVWNTFSLGNLTRGNLICEPSDLRLEHLLASVIKTYYKLQELGFTYHKGKIIVIDTDEVEND